MKYVVKYVWRHVAIHATYCNLLQHRSDIKIRFQTSRLGVRDVSGKELLSHARETCGGVRQISIHLFMQHIGAGGG
jgi:hypothetical protein